MRPATAAASTKINTTHAPGTASRICVVSSCYASYRPQPCEESNPNRKTAFGREAKDQCLRCHDPENSPTFNQPAYWAKIKHGETKAVMPEGGK